MRGKNVDVVNGNVMMSFFRLELMNLITGEQIDAAVQGLMIEHPVEEAVGVAMMKGRVIFPVPLKRTIGLETIDFSLLIVTEATSTIDREGDMDFIRVGCINVLERIDGVEAERRRHRRVILPLKAERS